MGIAGGVRGVTSSSQVWEMERKGRGRVIGLGGWRFGWGRGLKFIESCELGIFLRIGWESFDLGIDGDGEGEGR